MGLVAKGGCLGSRSSGGGGGGGGGGGRNGKDEEAAAAAEGEEARPAPVPQPASMASVGADGARLALSEYQLVGLNWLLAMKRLQLGCILADDMGLGKTVQARAHSTRTRHAHARAHGTHTARAHGTRVARARARHVCIVTGRGALRRPRGGSQGGGG